MTDSLTKFSMLWPMLEVYLEFYWVFSSSWKTMDGTLMICKWHKTVFIVNKPNKKDSQLSSQPLSMTPLRDLIHNLNGNKLQNDLMSEKA